MPKFVTFFSYSRSAAQAMIDKPTDRTAAARALVKSLGGKMDAFYWMNGNHDGFLIATYPAGTNAAALSVAAGATGAIEGLETYEIFDRDAQAEIVKAAKAAAGSYKPPTA
jgi:uncharacterized protein with GYD domain